MRPAEPLLAHPRFRGVKLMIDDVAAGEALSTEAGWNQTPEDWRFFLQAGVGFGFEDSDGRLVASALLLPYESRFAWISMVLVSSAARRQRVATALLQHALHLGREHAWVLLLDASPEGREVYLRLGFRDLRPITRWHRPSPAGVATAQFADPFITDAWAEWDAACFGASRRPLLQWLEERSPAIARAKRDAHGRPTGYRLGRPGRVAFQIGPVVAETEADAHVLLAGALAAWSGPAIVDLVDGRPTLDALLRSHGFTPWRNFVRMIHGDAAEPGRPEKIFALAGPEFG